MLTFHYKNYAEWTDAFEEVCFEPDSPDWPTFATQVIDYMVNDAIFKKNDDVISKFMGITMFDML